MAAESSGDVESLLRSALRPIEPPENLPGRVEETLSAVTEAAAEELSAWAEELSESELRSLRDPRNWVRPAAAIAAEHDVAEVFEPGILRMMGVAGLRGDDLRTGRPGEVEELIGLMRGEIAEDSAVARLVEEPGRP